MLNATTLIMTLNLSATLLMIMPSSPGPNLGHASVSCVGSHYPIRSALHHRPIRSLHLGGSYRFTVRVMGRSRLKLRLKFGLRISFSFRSSSRQRFKCSVGLGLGLMVIIRLGLRFR